MPGRTFRLDGHDVASLSRSYVVTEVEHTAYAAEAAPAGQPLYRNRFECTVAEAPIRPKRVRKPQLHAAVRLTVATPGGGFREAADDEVGELWLGGPAITPGYYNQPAATAEALIRDEAGQRWLRSGDLARRDRDGYYYVVDRSKDMFISGGENVYPAEVENVLYAHPSVAEAAVIGVADERWGEVGRAFVVLKADADPGSAEAALLLHCQAQLGRFKVPRSVVFLAALPRNAAGKVLKHELKRRAPAT